MHVHYICNAIDYKNTFHNHRSYMHARIYTGLGPVPWLIVNELFTKENSEMAISYAATTNWSFNFLIGLFFPLVSSYLEAYSFVPFAVVCVVVMVLLMAFLPETAGICVIFLGHTHIHGHTRTCPLSRCTHACIRTFLPRCESSHFDHACIHVFT